MQLSRREAISAVAMMLSGVSGPGVPAVTAAVAEAKRQGVRPIGWTLMSLNGRNCYGAYTSRELAEAAQGRLSKRGVETKMFGGTLDSDDQDDMPL